MTTPNARKIGGIAIAPENSNPFLQIADLLTQLAFAPVTDRRRTSIISHVFRRPYSNDAEKVGDPAGFGLKRD